MPKQNELLKEIEELRSDRDFWKDMFHKEKIRFANAEMQKLEMKINKMDLNPGDVVIITAPGEITLETAERLKAHMEEHLPGVKALIFSDGLEVEKQNN